MVDHRATVAFRGNRYSVVPGMQGATVTLRHRLGTKALEIYSRQARLIRPALDLAHGVPVLFLYLLASGLEGRNIDEEIYALSPEKLAGDKDDPRRR